MTTNVRFYRLGVLPPFEVDKHNGIFVHVTGIMYKNGENPKEPNALLMNIKRETLVQWLTERRIDKIASGLWFGGENGWELLSNDTTSGAIDAAIEAKIKGLDVGGYAQAEITPDTPAEGVPNSSTLTIKGIQEVDGKIGIPADSENLDLDIAIDGVYNESTNKIATQSTVTKAIEALDVNTVQAVTFNTSNVNGNTTLTFKGIKEVDGKIAQGDDANPSTLVVGDAKLKIQIGSDEAGAFEVFSANAKENGAIKLNEYVFKNDGDVISVITPTAVSERNRLVTEQDIANLSGAMHYRGGVTSLPQPDQNTKQGDVWIVTTAFDGYEAGDMFIARADGASATFDKVQGNITLGTGDGQIAKNVGALLENKLVIATSGGIKTSEISTDVFTDGNNTRTLSIANGTADTLVASLYHDVTITDALTVIGKPFTKSIKISSPNRSIEIAKNDDTGVMVDLVWNTSMEQ